MTRESTDQSASPASTSDKAATRSRARRRVESLGRRPVPLRWTSLLGVVSSACLVVLLVTGIVLMFFFDPSSDTIRYHGSYAPLRGVPVSKSYASVLHVSLDVRGGLLVRQAHHWAALVLPASLMLQLLTRFFTGAFRRPRQWAWTLLALTFVLALVAGWSGYGLPDDSLSGTGLRIFQGILVGVPVIGSDASFIVFGGEFPGDVVRHLYWLHVAVLPVLFVAVLVLRLRLALRQRPAQTPAPGRTENDVAGLPLTAIALRAVGLFIVSTSVLFLLAGVLTIDPLWTYGPSSSGEAAAGSQPDWYTAFLDGALRLVPPNWELHVLGGTVPVGLLIPQAVAGIFLAAVVLWPFLEARVSGDRAEHHLLDRPREHPTRTALGVTGLVFYATLWAAGATDIVTTQLSVPFEHEVFALRTMLVLGPAVAFWLTRQLCLALVDHDREEAAHGFETGMIVRDAEGGYSEVLAPLSAERRAIARHERSA